MCGCGECEFCQKLTEQLRSNLTKEQKEYDDYKERIGSFEADEGPDYPNSSKRELESV